MRFLLAILVAAVSLTAQTRDFLTPDEVDQIRLAQEPNERLKLYVTFARQRIDLIEQQFAKEKPGRSVLIREKLDEYTKIIEAIDTVVEDSLRRKLPLSVGLAAVAEAEKEIAAKLVKIQESEPKDLSRYQFVLEQAIETTNDSAELNAKDLSSRTEEVAAKVEKEKKDREEMLAPVEPATATVKPDAAKAAEIAEKKEEKKQRKAPTLLRKGEVPVTKKPQ